MSRKNTHISCLRPFLCLIVLGVALNGCKPKPVETPPVETGITGKVADASNNQSIGGALVTTAPPTSSANTTQDGYYSIPNVSAGQYSVSATKAGYRQNSITVTVRDGQTVNGDIQLTVIGPELSVSPSLIDFGPTLTSTDITISNSTGVGTLSWSAVKDTNWLTISPTSGSVTSGSATLNVRADRTGLSFGVHRGTIAVTSNGGSISIPVVLTNPSPNPPVLVVNPSSLDFDSTKIQLSLAVSNSGTGTLTWSASGNQSWVSLSPSAGSNIGTINVTVNRGGLNPGTYSGVIIFTSNGGSYQIPIAMKVSGVSSVLFYESFESLSAWTNQGSPGWIIVDSTYYWGKPLNGKCAASEVGGFGYGDSLKRQISLAQSGTLHLWVRKWHYDSVRIYLYVDGVLQWSWGGGQTWGDDWTEMTSTIDAGIHQIEIKTDFAGVAMIDELTITQ